MKKLIVISILFVSMILASLWEIYYTTKFYNQIISLTMQLEVTMKENEQQLDGAQPLSKLEAVEHMWHKGKNLVMMLGNHQVVRNADEKLVSLGGYIRENQKADAFVSLSQYLHYIEHISTDNHPLFTNLF